MSEDDLNENNKSICFSKDDFYINYRGEISLKIDINSIDNKIEKIVEQSLKFLKEKPLHNLSISGVKLSYKSISNFEKSIESFINYLGSITNPDKKGKDFLKEIEDYNEIISERDELKKRNKELEEKLLAIKKENDKLKEELYSYSSCRKISNLDDINISEEVEIDTKKEEIKNKNIKIKELLKKSLNKKKKLTKKEIIKLEEEEEINEVNYIINYSKNEKQKKDEKQEKKEEKERKEEKEKNKEKEKNEEKEKK